MQKLLPATQTRPLHSVASSRLIEAALLAASPAQALMARAGLALAKLAAALSGGGPVWIVCGPGNNGGDGLVAARLLHASGRPVRVSLIADDRPAPADARAALQAAIDAGVVIGTELDPPPGLCLAVDALLGLGLNRAPAAAVAVAITRLNALSRPVLAVDLPSGLLADSGALAGPDAVRASHTLALLTLKPGLFTAQGRALCGQLWFDGLGVVADAPADASLLGADCLHTWSQARSPAGHKGSFGDVLVLGGASGLRGAALLAARASLAAGAGRVYVGLLNGDPSAELDAARPELMLWPQDRLADPSGWRSKTIVSGCGGGDAIAARLPAVLAQAQRLVLDADGLNAVAADPALQALLGERAAQGQATVLTPHPLEAARLLGCSSADVQGQRLAAAQALSERFACTVILKGSGSIIASPGRPPSINSSGSAALATAGTGDVLAGWLGGLWAQRPGGEPHGLACAATFWHGAAAETQALGPLRAADLIERMHTLDLAS